MVASRSAAARLKHITSLKARNKRANRGLEQFTEGTRMHSIAHITTTHITVTPPHKADPHRTADRAYQGLTIAAMLLLLVSLWAF
jgi:hypothetical protein